MCVQILLTQAAVIYKNLFERESKNSILKIIYSKCKACVETNSCTNLQLLCEHGDV